MDKRWKLTDLQGTKRANGDSMCVHRKVNERANGN